MSNSNFASIGDALSSLHTRPGIILGPDATRADGDLGRLVLGALRTCKIEFTESSLSDADCRSLIDKVRASFPQKSVLLEAEVREAIRKISPALDIEHLSRAGWSACISLTEDLIFENALRTHLDSVAGSRSLTLVDRPGVNPPTRTIPIYKLIGNVQATDPESQVALSEAELLIRQQDWRALLQSVPDFVQEAPIFVIGTSNCVPLTREVLSALLAMPKPRPNRLFFFKNDSTLSDPTVAALSKRFETRIVDASLRDLCTQLAVQRTGGVSRKPPTSDLSPSRFKDLLSQYEEIVTHVSAAADAMPLTGIDLPTLLDGLFRPGAQNWKPFQENLDIRRDVTGDVVASVENLLAAAGKDNLQIQLVRGEAGVGKTTLLKRASIELARSGVIVLWCKRTTGGTSARIFKALATDLSDWTRAHHIADARFVVVCDDPWALRIDPVDLMACFARFAVSLVLVFSVRNSDFAIGEATTGLNGIEPNREIEIPFDLVPSEIAQLAPLLVRIGAAKDNDAAEREVARIPSKHAKDILCSLWYLIPETRMQLEESLRDEYCRLGNVAETVGSLAQVTRSRSGSVAHAAYEFVTVTSNLNIGLPLEVLVRALEVNYSDWLDVAGQGRPLWGLLYDLEDTANETLVYFTRNEVVTRVLLDLVNGGVGHAGEFRVLKRLLAACRAGAIVYRNFALDILIRGRKRLADVFSYSQGLELFELVRDSLPHEDRLLEHHLGIWMQDVGRDDDTAYRQFEHALQTGIYPGSEREVPREFIHTSMAASLIKLIRAGKQDPEGGAAQVREHLRQAGNPRFFNSHTSHVSATLLFDLAKLDPEGMESDGAMKNIAEAFQEIEKARQVVGSRARYLSKNRANVEMMADLEKRVLASIADVSKLSQAAIDLFSRTRSQAGFEVCARRMLVEASQTGKGKDFNVVSEYIKACFREIDKALARPSIELLVVKVDLIVRWRVHAFQSVEWAELRDVLKEILNNDRYRDDIIKMFYLGVAHFHCGETTDANVLFATIRRWQPIAYGAREPRCCFVDAMGNPRRFQGAYRKDFQQWYFDVQELDVSVPSRGTPSYGAGAVAHAYLGFALNGPLALEHRPDKADYLLR